LGLESYHQECSKKCVNRFGYAVESNKDQGKRLQAIYRQRTTVAPEYEWLAASKAFDKTFQKN
jgi:hypothetical protein